MSSEASAIQACVDRYVNGIVQSDLKMVASAFHPDAVMTGHFGGQYMAIPKAGDFIADYMKKLPPTSEHSPNYNGKVTGLEQHGTMARVSLEEHQLEGKDMHTVLILHKIDGGWLIAQKGTWAPE